MVRFGWRKRLRGELAEERELIRRRGPGVVGCFWYLLIILVVLLILSVLFGGFRKGTKYNGSGPVGRPAAVAFAGVAPAGAVSDIAPC